MGTGVCAPRTSGGGPAYVTHTGDGREDNAGRDWAGLGKATMQRKNMLGAHLIWAKRTGNGTGKEEGGGHAGG